MIIGVAYENGNIQQNLGECDTFLVIETDGNTPVSKRLSKIQEKGHMSILKFANAEKIDVLICGTMGIAARNALEMIGVLLVPGCTGSAEEAVAKFLIGEKQGDPTFLDLAREEDPDDPMACMHDCAKCAGCGPIEILKKIPEN